MIYINEVFIFIELFLIIMFIIVLIVVLIYWDLCVVNGVVVINLFDCL